MLRFSRDSAGLNVMLICLLGLRHPWVGGGVCVCVCVCTHLHTSSGERQGQEKKLYLRGYAFAQAYKADTLHAKSVLKNIPSLCNSA